MEKATINVELCQGNAILNKWEETNQSNLPGLISSVGKVKVLVNEYLTELVNKARGDTDKLEVLGKSDDEEDEESSADDPLMSVLNQIKSDGKTVTNTNESGKRKSSNINDSKRLKK